MSNSPPGTIVSSVRTITTTITVVSELPNGGLHVGVVPLGATPEIVVNGEAKFMCLPSERTDGGKLYFEREISGSGVSIYEELKDGSLADDIRMPWDRVRALADFLVDCLVEHGEKENA